MKYYLKEEFLHDTNVKNAGNKARNDVEEIVKRADDLLYKGKTGGRNQIVEDDDIFSK